MAEEKRFLNYENSFSIYRSKTAMILGVLYFTQGYQSAPVIGLQFAQVNDEHAEQKTFNWDSEEKIWYFPTYDKCYEFYHKLLKWKQIMTLLKKEEEKDNNAIADRFKDFTEKQKLSNPMKRKSIYLSVKYYNGYLFTMTLLFNKTSVGIALHEFELDMLIQYVGDFIKDYHKLTLMHRQLSLSRGTGKTVAGKNSTDNKSSRSNRTSSSEYEENDEPQSQPPPKTTGNQSVDSILNGGTLDDIMKGINDEDVPF